MQVRPKEKKLIDSLIDGCVLEAKKKLEEVKKKSG